MASNLYRAVLPTLIAVDDAADYRIASPAIVGSYQGKGESKDGAGNGVFGGFEYLRDPVKMSGGDMLSYNGPIRQLGSIVEVGVRVGDCVWVNERDDRAGSRIVRNFLAKFCLLLGLLALRALSAVASSNLSSNNDDGNSFDLAIGLVFVCSAGGPRCNSLSCDFVLVWCSDVVPLDGTLVKSVVDCLTG